VPCAPVVEVVRQGVCGDLDVSRTAALAADLVRRAAERGVDLLVLPELFLTGYGPTAIAADPDVCALRAEDARLEALALGCAETRTAMMVGAPACDPKSGRLHISALILDRNCHAAAWYVKQYVDSCE